MLIPIKNRIFAVLRGHNRAETACNCCIAALCLFFVFAFLLVLTATRYPRALMWLVRPLNHVWMPLLWLGMCAILIRMMLAAFRVTNVRFRAVHRYVLLGAILVSGALFYTIILNREMLYFWDYRTYYSFQLGTENAFAQDLRKGFSELYIGLMQSDYTPFICLFTEFPFCLTDRTEDAYLLCSFLTIMPALLVCTGGLLLRFADDWQIRRPTAFFVLGMLSVVCFPLLHAAYFNGQPDLLGLVFAMLILLLTQDYAFEAAQWGRWIPLFLATLFLIVTRRWYLFWILAFYGCYAASVVLRAIWEKDAARRRGMLRRLLSFGAASVALIAVLLFPMIRRVLSYDYAKNYSYYLGGGFSGELVNQSRYLGWICLAVLALGFVWGCCARSRRRDVCIACVSWFVAVLLFTRIQNMGAHQSLLLMPSYLTLLFAGIGCLCSIPGSVPALLSMGACGAALALNMAFAVLGNPAWDAARCFTSLSLHYDNRPDRRQVLEIDRWLLERCDGLSDVTVTAYMIPHGVEYNPDIFNAAMLPDQSMFDILSYGSAIPGTHAFPLELFDAKYVLTCDPFSYTGIADKYNDVFLHNGYLEKRFQLVKTVDMPTGYTFYIYERIAPIDRAEVETYRTALAAEDAAFPAMFGDVLDIYINYHKLK